MRFLVKKQSPKINDIKEVRKFAFWPVRIDDEIIWLEFYYVTYEYRDVFHYLNGDKYPDWVEINKSV